MNQLVVGIVLILLSFGLLMVCRPRQGKIVWFMTKPLVGPSVSILLTTGVVVGILFIAAYFTTIDNTTLTG